SSRYETMTNRQVRCHKTESLFSDDQLFLSGANVFYRWTISTSTTKNGRAVHLDENRNNKKIQIFALARCRYGPPRNSGDFNESDQKPYRPGYSQWHFLNHRERRFLCGQQRKS